MEFITGILPESILLITSVIVFLMLSLGKNSFNSYVYCVVIVVAEFIASVVSGFLFEKNVDSFFSGSLFSDSNYLLVRIFIFFVSAVLIFFIQLGKEIPESKKTEIYFFILWISLLDSMVLMSRNLLFSFLCIFAISMISIFLTTLSLRQNKEICKTNEGWEQTVACLLIGFIALFLLSFISGSVTIEGFRNIVSKSGQNHFYLVLILCLLLPYWKLSGIFPFHYRNILQAKFSAWSIHGVQTILVHGVGVMVLSKLLIMLYTSTHELSVINVPLLFQVIGMVGILLGAVSALLVLDVKSFISQLALVQWSASILLVALGSAVALSASIFQFLSAGTSILLFFILFGAYFEKAAPYLWAEINGFGKQYLFEGIVVLIGFLSLLGIPPFFGFQNLRFFIDTSFSGFFFDIQMILILLVGIQMLLTGRIISRLFFCSASNPARPIDILESIPMRLIILFLVSMILAVGLFGESLWNSLLEKTNSFIIF